HAVVPFVLSFSLRPSFYPYTTLFRSSKSFGLINRFSEDIDITVFRGDLGQAATVEDLEALSGKKRKAKLDAIKTASNLALRFLRSEEHTSELQSRRDVVCRLLLDKKK